MDARVVLIPEGALPYRPKNLVSHGLKNLVSQTLGVENTFLNMP